ncbi:hypothetical protein CTA1_11956 [Colletotrichum tanaceti]|uniref:Uncharacterized protein n=1 Tax=Colletotrichum tanaceti TaxID=1306861 RepID=A0A4U6WZR5_9PEZI|nr:hypothetical protein CTA1_11956 [Colletotrichum tanaceti]
MSLLIQRPFDRHLAGSPAPRYPASDHVAGNKTGWRFTQVLVSDTGNLKVRKSHKTSPLNRPTTRLSISIYTKRTRNTMASPTTDYLLNENGIPPFDTLPLGRDDPRFSAWGLYGHSDELGTLNRLTDERVAAAARNEIRTGAR